MGVGAWVVFWVVLSAILFVLESSTAQFICIWFAVGAIVAIVPAALDADLWVQLLVFLASSNAFLFLIRPVLRRKLKVERTATNYDRVIGTDAWVIEDIDNLRESGRVSASGLTWSARSESGETIPRDTQVEVQRVEGVKLIVALKGSEE